jgi:hypothetical protein
MACRIAGGSGFEPGSSALADPASIRSAAKAAEARNMIKTSNIQVMRG